MASDDAPSRVDSGSVRIFAWCLVAVTLLSSSACSTPLHSKHPASPTPVHSTHHAPPTPLQRWIANPPMYVAHRGGDVNWTEGTAYAYAQAAAWNPDLALEVPIQRSSDGVWVVSEDVTTRRVFGADYVIGATPWRVLSTLKTTRGRHPMARLVDDVLDVYGRTRILFLEDKTDQDLTAFFDLLDSFAGRTHFVIKSYFRAVDTPVEAHRRGYVTWGYYYADNMAQFAATQGRFDLLGLNSSAPAADFARMRATGKPVLAHVIASRRTAELTTGEGVSGLMVSNVVRVIPH